MHMNTTVKALQDLYVALGGDASDVDNCVTIVEVLNAISEKYGGEGNAVLNPVAIENIAEVADSIGGGGSYTYVVPEQTIALPSESGSYTDIQINTDLLDVDTPYLLFYSVDGLVVGGTGYIIASYYNIADDEEGLSVDSAPFDIAVIDGIWKIAPHNPSKGKDVTLKAIPCSQIF